MTGQAGGYHVLTAAQRATLTAIQDELVPREGDRPSAGEAGGAAAVDSYLHARPTLRTDVLTVLAAVDASAQSRADGQSGSASPMSPFAALPAPSAAWRYCALSRRSTPHRSARWSS